MGSKYIWNINPVYDYLLGSIMYGSDIGNKQFEADIYSDIGFIIGEIIDNDDDLAYLDFEIKGDGNNFTVIGRNVVTALWFSGIFVEDLEFVSKKNVFLIGNRKYRYNKKNNKLTYNIIDE